MANDVKPGMSADDAAIEKIQFTPDWVGKISYWIFHYRKPLLILFVLITILLGAMASQLRVQAAFTKMIPLKHPYMATFLEYQSDFGGANKVLVALKNKQGSIYDKQFMDSLRKVTEEVFFVPGVERSSVSSLFTSNVRYNEVVEDGFRGGNVVSADFAGTPEQMVKVQENLLKSDWVGRLVSNDQTAAMVVATLMENDPETGERLDLQAVAAQLEGIRAKYENENTGVHIIGFAKAVGDIAKGAAGVLVFFGIAFVITALLLYWYSGSLMITALALILTIDRTLNAIWRVRKPRPLGQRVLVYWALMTLGPIFLALSLSLTSYALSASKGLVGGLPGGVELLLERSVPFVVKSALLPETLADRQEFEAWAKTIPWMEEVPSYAMFFYQRGRHDKPALMRRIQQVRIDPQVGIAVMNSHPDYRQDVKRFCRDFTSPKGDRLFDCSAGKNGCVDAYGFYQPCLMLRDPSLTTDLRTSPLKEAVENSRPRLREKVATHPDYLARCARCFLHGLCDSCPAASYAEHGRLDQPVDYFCQVTHAMACDLGLLAEGEQAWEVLDWKERVANLGKDSI
mgnify:CR=1 FL=1